MGCQSTAARIDCRAQVRGRRQNRCKRRGSYFEPAEEEMAALLCPRPTPFLGAKPLPAFASTCSCSVHKSQRLVVRCQGGHDNSNPLSGLRASVDKATKNPVTDDDVLVSQFESQAEKQSVLGAVPNSNSMYARPERERRAETVSRSFGSIFALDGAAPEVINGRLAMLGFVWALSAEKWTGLTVIEQIYNPTTSGLVFFVGAVQVFTYASMIPIMNGETTDARSWGPFNARAERWNGRLAMIGFAALIVDEMIRQGALIH